MDNLRLVVIIVLFLASRLRQAHSCFSQHHCCSNAQIKDLGTHLQGPTVTPLGTHQQGSTVTPTSDTNCRATSRGSVAQRSISPWTYTKDFSDRRYPQNLWQASCSCNHCLSFKATVQQNVTTYSSEEMKGNSVPVPSSILVFYREQCPGKSDLFYLRPHNYVVNVSCACVVPTTSSKGRKLRELTETAPVTQERIAHLSILRHSSNLQRHRK